jgi:tetratricopeptide (TPR) repeat protein
MRRHCRHWRCGAVLLLLLSSRGARPQSPPGRPSERQEQLHQADAAFHAGYAAVQNGDLAAAREDFQRVVQLAPEIPEGHGALGSVLLQLGRPALAVPELEEALAMKPGDRTTQTNLAVAYEETGAYDKSLALFRALDRDAAEPITGSAAISYVRALSATGSADAALARMQRAVAAAAAGSEDAAELRDALGSLYAQRRDWPAAESQFQQALADDPNFAAAHLHLGVTLAAEGRAADSIRELTTASQLAPNDASAQLELGRALIAAGQDDQALPTLQEAVKLAPDLLDAKYQLALALQGAGQEAQSIPLFEEVVAAEPRNSDALTNLALALVQTGKSKDAIALYQRALAEAPSDPLIHQDLGVAYLQQSDLDDAIREFRAGLALRPDSYELHYNLGLALKLKDDVGGAEVELKQAAKLNPESPDPPFTLGILKMQTGRFDEAAEQLKRALDLRPANGDAWAILGSVYKQENNLPAAADALRQAIRLSPGQPGTHITLAGVLAEQGRKDEAASERKIAADLTRAATNRQRATFAVNSGNLLMQQGKISDAIERYQDAVASDPTYVEGHRGLADALARAGRTTEADAERQKAAEMEKPKT